ncbi:hypothetical protein LIER_38026 [Lithospermum erythrorhizon]|uniref:DUF7054 domain-containing protein n=1 Tax=Lithospermum erythrorhizon TaxID=34254 RepID=A0AAV3PTL1_LITER
MPSPRNHRKVTGEEKNITTKKVKPVYRASSFHGQDSGAVREMMRRPRTVPNLLIHGGAAAPTLPELHQIYHEHEEPKKLPKLLLNVTIQRSLGPVHVVMLPDSSVGELIAAAVHLYVKEARRPVLSSVDPAGFDLHYSQFSLESLSREEKLITLGSRNFFLCPVKASVETNGSCSKEVEKATKLPLPWLKFMDLLL